MFRRFDTFYTHTNFIKAITEIMIKFVINMCKFVIVNYLSQDRVSLKALDHTGCKC